MAVTMQLRSRSQAMADIAAHLAAEGTPEMVVASLIASHLRAICEIGITSDAEGTSTAHLTEAVHRNVSGVLPPVADFRVLVEKVRDRLAITGDLWRGPGGRWQPTPGRAVVLPGSYFLVLGTLAARPKNLVASGAVRFLASRAPPDLPTQHVDDWLGHEDTLPVWMENALRHYGSRLQRSGVDADHLQIYAPDQARRLSRASWISANDLELTGTRRLLCRASADKAEIYNRPYFLGEFAREDGRVRLLNAAQVDHAHARRFRFAFDAVLAAPRRIRARQVGDVVQLTIANDLPPQEAKVLALGWSASDKVSPAMRRMVFPQRAMPFVAHAFARLGMTIEEGA